MRRTGRSAQVSSVLSSAAMCTGTTRVRKVSCKTCCLGFAVQKLGALEGWSCQETAPTQKRTTTCGRYTVGVSSREVPCCLTWLTQSRALSRLCTQRPRARYALKLACEAFQSACSRFTCIWAWVLRRAARATVRGPCVASTATSCARRSCLGHIAPSLCRHF